MLSPEAKVALAKILKLGREHPGVMKEIVNVLADLMNPVTPFDPAKNPTLMSMDDSFCDDPPKVLGDATLVAPRISGNASANGRAEYQSPSLTKSAGTMKEPGLLNLGRGAKFDMQHLIDAGRDWYNVQEIARYAGCCFATVANWCKSGRIYAKMSRTPRNGKMWLVSINELRRYQRDGLLEVCRWRNL